MMLEDAIIRRHVAAYIGERDRGVPSEWSNIVLCAGASEGIRVVMKLMKFSAVEGKKPGIMILTPQYPLYNASLAEYDMEQVDESQNWAMKVSELERSLNEARKTCEVRALVVINPDNSTGQVFTRENVENIIKFCHRERLFLFADEVYQHNIYAEGSAFHSFKKVMMEMGDPYNKNELTSFISCSKDYMGECGIMGGYSELVNRDPAVMAMLQKSISAKLCPSRVELEAATASTQMHKMRTKSGEEKILLDARVEEVEQEDSSTKEELARKEDISAKTEEYCNDIISSVIACEMFAKQVGEMAIECEDFDIHYGKALMELAGIFGNGMEDKPSKFLDVIEKTFENFAKKRQIMDSSGLN